MPSLNARSGYASELTRGHNDGEAGPEGPPARRGVLSLRTLTEERRQSDRSQDANDQNDDKKLNQREPLLVLCASAQLMQHGNPPWILLGLFVLAARSSVPTPPRPSITLRTPVAA